MVRYRSTYKPRSIRRYEGRSRRKFVWSIIISIILLFAIFNWVLPFLVGQLSFFNKSSIKNQDNIIENAKIPPPLLNIPFEATNTATINIQGFTSPNSKVKIYLDDSLVSTTTSDDKGGFVTDSIDLALGTNNIVGRTVDENDKESLPSKTIQVIYSSEKPKLEISEPSDGKEITGGDKKVIVIGLTDSENEVTINGYRVIVNGDGHFSTQVSLNDGDNTLVIVATNPVGNTTSLERRVKYTP